MNPSIRVTNIVFGEDSGGVPITTATVFLATNLLEAEIEIELPRDTNLERTLERARDKLEEFSYQIRDALDGFPIFAP